MNTTYTGPVSLEQLHNAGVERLCITPHGSCRHLSWTLQDAKSLVSTWKGAVDVLVTHDSRSKSLDIINFIIEAGLHGVVGLSDGDYHLDNGLLSRRSYAFEEKCAKYNLECLPVKYGGLMDLSDSKIAFHPHDECYDLDLPPIYGHLDEMLFITSEWFYVGKSKIAYLLIDNILLNETIIETIEHKNPSGNGRAARTLRTMNKTNSGA